MTSRNNGRSPANLPVLSREGRDVSYFEAMVGFSPNASVGTTTLRACSAVDSWNLHSGGSLPGFVSMTLTGPAGCRTGLFPLRAGMWIFDLLM